MFTRKPWWSALAAVAVIGLVPAITHAHKQVELSGYPNDMGRGPVPAVNTADVAAQVDQGLVLVNTDMSYQGAVGAGTGIVVSPDGVVLTNNHVVEGATQISATSVADGDAYPATVIGYDRKHDIAVLQLQGAGGLPTAPLDTSSQVAIGDPVTAIGNARGQGLRRSQGAVTALNQTITAADDLASPEQLNGLIQVSANVIPGDSGGPLVSSDGQVIGIDTAASGNYRLSERGDSEGFAIPIGTAMSIAAQIRSGASSGSVHVGNTAMLGIGVKSLDQGGVAVAQVLRGSPADHAGIAPGDVITGFAGNTVTSDTALTDLLDQQYPGNTVPVTWLDRSGQQHSGNVALAAGPVG
ncbi:MAG: trypsin-like peptidase domain-containing protein [Mycobacteriaceae bacterium]|nr:trypsin-like peptidase domain-containing protein [Mycobacteriaceae bacterium]MBV9641556.1 trypsin-like peptidase domain-containing protein [Mycobacteriaceae bacterium]